MKANDERLCRQNLIHAYVDGELTDAALSIFESHLHQCAACRTSLRSYQQFICELDAAFVEETNVSLPTDFSRVVAARAVSDMSGVRSFRENKKALAISIILGIAGFALLGTSTRQMLVVLVRQVFVRIFALIEFVWTTISDSIASVAVISRVLGRKFIVETGNSLIAFALLVFGIVLLSRLISNYHRTGTIE